MKSHKKISIKNNQNTRKRERKIIKNNKKQKRVKNERGRNKNLIKDKK